MPRRRHLLTLANKRYRNSLCKIIKRGQVMNHTALKILIFLCWVHRLQYLFAKWGFHKRRHWRTLNYLGKKYISGPRNQQEPFFTSAEIIRSIFLDFYVAIKSIHRSNQARAHSRGLDSMTVVDEVQKYGRRLKWKMTGRPRGAAAAEQKPFLACVIGLLH